jgi:hypothetical protein
VKIKLFGDLFRLSKQYKGAKVLINIQMAAIHLFFMIQGYKLPNQLVIQYAVLHVLILLSFFHRPCQISLTAQMSSIRTFPLDIISSELFTMSCRSTGGTVQIDAEQMAFIQSLMKKCNPYKRKYPLYIALFISPLALLVDKQLMSRCLDQLDLLTVSRIAGQVIVSKESGLSGFHGARELSATLAT